MAFYHIVLLILIKVVELIIIRVLSIDKIKEKQMRFSEKIQLIEFVGK